MKLLEKIACKIKGLIGTKTPAPFGEVAPIEELAERLARLERHYLVLLKEMLRKDGVEIMIPKSANGPAQKFNQVAMQTPSAEEVDPPTTIH